MRIPIPFLPRSVVFRVETSELSRFRVTLPGLMSAVVIASLWLGGAVDAEQLRKRGASHYLQFAKLKSPDGKRRAPDPRQLPPYGFTPQERWHFERQTRYHEQARVIDSALMVMLAFWVLAGVGSVVSRLVFGRKFRPMEARTAHL